MTDHAVLLCAALIAGIVTIAAGVTGPVLERALVVPEREPAFKREVICHETPARTFLAELAERHADGSTTSQGSVEAVTRHEPHLPFECGEEKAWPK